MNPRFFVKGGDKNGVKILKKHCQLLFGGYEYNILWSQLQTEKDLRGWIKHLSSKIWMDILRLSIFENRVRKYRNLHLGKSFVYDNSNDLTREFDGCNYANGSFSVIGADELLKNGKEEPGASENVIFKTGGLNMLELFRDGDRFGIVTDAADERTFIEQFSSAVSELVHRESDPVKRRAEMNHWIRQSFEVICRLRGYKSTVRTRTLIEAGEFTPGQSALEAKVDDHGSVLVPDMGGISR